MQERTGNWPEKESPVKVPETVLAAMRRANSLFEAEVVGKCNIDALDLIYTANARVLPPGAPMIVGREGIKAFWKHAIESLGVQKAVMTGLEAEEFEDRIVEIGKAQLELASGQTVEVKYVVVWRIEGEHWKWAIDIWNMNG